MAISGKLLLLRLNEALRSQGSGGSVHDLFKLDENNKLQLLKLPQVDSDAASGNDLVRKSQFDSGIDALDGRVDTAESKLDVLQGADSIPGSVAKAEKDSKAYTDQKIADLIGSSPELLNTLQELAEALDNDPEFAANLAQSLGELDSRLDVVQGGAEVTGSILHAVEGERARAESAEQIIDGRLDVLQGSDGTPGSVDYKVKVEKDRAEAIEQGLEIRLAEVESDIENLASSSAITDLALRVTTAEGEIDALQADVALKASESALSAVDQKVIAAEGEIDTLQSEMDAVEGRAGALEGRMNTAESDINSLESGMALKASQADLDDLDGYAQDIRSDLDNLDGYAQDIRSDVDDMEPRVASLEAAMPGKASAASVSALDVRLVTAEGEIDQLQSDVDAAELAIADKVSQSDFDILESKVNVEHDARIDVAEQDIDDLQSDMALKANASDVSTALSGKADLVDGKISQAQIPAIAIVDTFEASSESEMLALSAAEQGDVCIRSDLNKTFILASGSYSVLANWKELKTPTDAVLSVNGQTGAVSLSKSDVGLGSVDNTSDSAKPISDLTQAALDLKADQSSVTTSLAGKASTSLNNLASTSINADLVPSAASTRSLGSSVTNWSSVYASTYSFGLASSLVSMMTAGQSRTVTFVSGSADITCNTAPSVSVGRIVHFTVSGGTLPSGISSGSRYFVKTVSGSVITVSSTSGGAAIVVSSAGTGVITAVFSQSINLWAQNYGDLSLLGYSIALSPQNNGSVSIGGSLCNVSAPLNMLNHITPSASGLRDLGGINKVFRDVYSSTIRMYGTDNSFGGVIFGNSADGIQVGSNSVLGLAATDGVTISGTGLDIQTGTVALNGGSMSGVGSISGLNDPSADSHAANKKYVDDSANAIRQLKVKEQTYEEFTLSAENLASVQVASPIIGMPFVMRQGVMGRPGMEFTVSGSTITFSGEWLHPSGVSAVEEGDKIYVYYMKEVDAF